MLNMTIENKNLTNISNQNVGHSVSNFDYSKWDKGSKIYLKDVPYQINSDYSNTFIFDSEQEKDMYFMNGREEILSIMASVSYTGEVSLPYDIDTLIGYNYLTVVSDKEDIIDTEGNITKYHYFINDITYVAPNTTKVTITLDVFNTFFYKVNIKRMLLSRGHYPHYHTKVDDYLNNPLENNTLLLEDDIVPNSSIVGNKDYTLLNEGVQYVVVTTTSPPDGNWDGKVADINGKRDIYKIPTNNYVWGFKASDYEEVFTYIDKNTPHLFQTITAMVVVSENYISKVYDFSLGATCSMVVSVEQVLQDVTITTGKFNYPVEYKEYAKLYTSPYSNITFTNGENVIDIKIENISNAKVHSRSLIDFPMFRIDAFISGIGGNTSTDIVVGSFDTNVSREIFNDKWNETLLSWNIPMYGVYQNNKYKYNSDNTYTIPQIRSEIDNLYSNSILNNNTIRDNNKGIADTKYNNSINSNIANRDISNININEQSQLTTLEVEKNKKLSNHQLYINDLQTEGNWYTEQSKANLAMASNNINVTSGVLGGVAQGITSGVGGGIMSVSSGLTNFVYTRLSIETQKLVAKETLYRNWAISMNEQYLLNGNDRDKTYTFETWSIPTTNSNGILGDYAYDVSDTSIGNNRDIRDINYNTSNSNISNTHNVEISNINDMNNTANTVLENDRNISKDKINADINTSGMMNNNQVGRHLGDYMTQAWGYNRFELSFNKMNEYDTKKVGDEFVMYGYTLNQLVDVDLMNLMSLFTHWQGSIMQIEGGSIPNKFINVLNGIFENGITLWNGNVAINDVNIYNNVRRINE